MTVVCACSLGSSGDELASLAARIAHALGEPLVLAHVVSDGDSASARAALSALVARIEGPRADSELLADSIHESLAAAAERYVATMLVVGYGESGRVAERLTRISRTPVLVVREPGALSEVLASERAARFVVGTDTGVTARAAEDAARRLATALGADLTFARVADPRREHARLGLPPAAHEHALAPEVETTLLEEIAARPGENATVLAARAAPDAPLVELAERLDADLLVVGKRTRSWLEERWYGSVSRAVLRAAPVSVLCVPRPLVRELPRITRRGRVLAASDLSMLGDHALAHALSLLGEGDTLHVVHVVEPALDPPVPEAVRVQRSAQRLRDLIARATSGRTLDVHVHVEVGPRAATILRIADREDVDSIVLGAHGRSGIVSAPIGAVALQVVASATRPVIVVPAPSE